MKRHFVGIERFCFERDSDDAKRLLTPLSITLRLQYSTQREFQFFKADSTCQPIMACTADGEIASYARWNFFPNGYDIEKHEPVDVYEFLPPGALKVYKVELYRELRTGMMKLRQKWMKKGACWGKSS